MIASREGFGTDLFKPDTSLFLIRRMGHQAEIEVEHFVDGVGWSDSPWRYPTYVEALAAQAKRKGIDCKTQLAERNGKQEIDGISFRLLKDVTPELTLQNFVEDILLSLSEVISDAELSLNGGPVWDDKNDAIYQKNERRFREEILHPLLRKMGYTFVYHTHGTDEAGRDFVFAETTKFQRTIYYALQAKKGDISGGSNSEIDGILGQINDAFDMSFRKIPEIPEIYIAVVIVATSGKFKNEALKKIHDKLKKYGPVGSVYFWNKEDIKALISQYWRKENG